MQVTVSGLSGREQQPVRLQRGPARAAGLHVVAELAQRDREAARRPQGVREVLADDSLVPLEGRPQERRGLLGSSPVSRRSRARFGGGMRVSECSSPSTRPGGTPVSPVELPGARSTPRTRRNDSARLFASFRVSGLSSPRSSLEAARRCSAPSPAARQRHRRRRRSAARAPGGAACGRSPPRRRPSAGRRLPRRSPRPPAGSPWERRMFERWNRRYRCCRSSLPRGSRQKVSSRRA